ncbi:MAG: excisionase family DNA-binding protein [Gemmatimonadales bacterium]|nr:excisionase family DNA-binding protein [Gemmatimonadales bacterium]
MKHRDRTWLTTGQAAQLCSVTPDTVLKWIRKGWLEAARTAGGHYRIKREELEPVLTDGRTSGRSLSRSDNHPPQPLRCWEYFSHGGDVTEECKACVVYRTRAALCFQMATLGPGIGHARRFCHTSCDDCVYYRRVTGWPTNVLVVTSDHDLVRRLKGQENERIALRFARNAYEASTTVQRFLPAFAVVDQDTFPAGDAGFLESLAYDPRLPGLKIVVAVPRGKAQVLGNGRDRHLVDRVIKKPFGPQQIADVIHDFPVESVEPGEGAV